jgi:hypothetical protein
LIAVDANTLEMLAYTAERLRKRANVAANTRGQRWYRAAIDAERLGIDG